MWKRTWRALRILIPLFFIFIGLFTMRIILLESFMSTPVHVPFIFYKSVINENGTNIEDLNNTIFDPLIISEENDYTEKLPLCSKTFKGLGSYPVERKYLNLSYAESMYPEVLLGGQYSPQDCVARHRVAIIVPYRDRETQLPLFLYHMHGFLMKQKIEYGIYVAEQYGDYIFNKARLMNLAFLESQKLKMEGWDCFIFHDVDLLPIDSRNVYSCPLAGKPRHMSVAIDKYSYRLPYRKIFGGVIAMTADQFTTVNGFSNMYWGWGGEDDDMYRRVINKKYEIERYSGKIAKYIMLKHKPSKVNKIRYKLLRKTKMIMERDGLSSLKYSIISIKKYHLYTHILADVEDHKSAT